MSDLGTYYHLGDLFDQLGLPSDEQSIETFIAQHAPLPESIHIWEADWWNPSQAEFIREALHQDANWWTSVDELNARLRQAPYK